MNILIIDDEKNVSDFFLQVALARGYTDLDTVASAEEALTHIIRRNYDLITLDIQMPGASGLEIIAMCAPCAHMRLSPSYQGIYPMRSPAKWPVAWM